MSNRKLSQLPQKTTPVIADEIYIVDSEDSSDATKSKRATLGSLPFTGEITTASNVGDGIGIFKQKSLANLEFKTIEAGANVTFDTNSPDKIVISSSGGGGGGGSGDLLAANNLSDVADANIARMNINQGLVNLTFAASIAVNGDAGNVFEIDMGGNATLLNPTNLKAGATYTFIIKQDANGGRELNFGTAYKFFGGITPILSSNANAVDILTFLTDGTNLYGSIQRNFS